MCKCGSPKAGGDRTQGLQSPPFPGSAGFEAPVSSVDESQRPGTLLPPAEQHFLDKGLRSRGLLRRP